MTLRNRCDTLSSPTTAGASLHCRHVIVTVPLLMLQRDCISFQPALPPAKLAAISRIKMSNAVKVGPSYCLCSSALALHTSSRCTRWTAPCPGLLTPCVG